MSDQAGRYQRSMSGMIGALVVTLLGIGAFVAFRALNRTDLEIAPEAVDYRALVSQVQAAGDDVVYPSSLPAGWIVTSANYKPGRDRNWDLGALTADDRFAGLHQADTSVERLVADLVDDNAEEGAPVRLDSPLAGTWRTFTDSGGDYAVAAEVGEDTLLVFGSAPPQQIRDLAESLVTTPLS